MQAAQSAVDLARQTLDADQQKLKVGLTTQTAILQDAATLTTGESNLVSAKAAYEKSRIELDRATGLLLDHAGIDVSDATRGQVTHLPNVPYVAPRQNSLRPRRLPAADDRRTCTIRRANVGSCFETRHGFGRHCKQWTYANCTYNCVRRSVPAGTFRKSSIDPSSRA